MILRVALVIGAYLLGSLPSALLLVRFATGKDVRLEGSGNVGATNALRTAGWRVGVWVTIIDVAKGAIPMALMLWVHAGPSWQAAAMVAAVLGHCYPVWLRFAGGKGVATGLGAFLVLSPVTAGCAIVVWLVVLLVGRWVSIASMLAAATFPLLLVVLEHPDPVLLTAISAIAVVIVIRHGSNVRMLLEGEEPRMARWWRSRS
jgi:glycerol-3-phosphate acyltransferase PlsY